MQTKLVPPGGLQRWMEIIGNVQSTFCINIIITLLIELLYYVFPTAVLRSSAFPRVSDFVSHFSRHIRNSLLCELTCIVSTCFVCQDAGEGEAGVRAAEWAGWDERLPGASQEKEQCRFPAVLSWKRMTNPATLPTPSFMRHSKTSFKLHAFIVYWL